MPVSGLIPCIWVRDKAFVSSDAWDRANDVSWVGPLLGLMHFIEMRLGLGIRSGLRPGSGP